jgi:hypothetical protein
MAGLNNIGLYITNTTAADASANVSSNHWRLFSVGSVATSGGVYAVDSSGSILRLSGSSGGGSGSITVSGNAVVSDVTTLQFSGLTVSTPNAGIALVSAPNYGNDIAALSGAVDTLDLRVDTLESTTNNHEVRIDNLETSVTTVSNSLATIMQGSVTCNPSSYVYTVSHPAVPSNAVFPIVSMVIPNSGSVLYVQGVTNRTTTSFDVIISETPTITGYAINWTIPLSGSAVVVRAYDVSVTNMISGSYSPNAGAYDTFELIYSNAVTVNQPTSMAAGQTINIITRSISASSSLTWSGYLFPGTPPVATSGGTDIYTVLRAGSNYYVTYAQMFG